MSGTVAPPGALTARSRSSRWQAFAVAEQQEDGRSRGPSTSTVPVPADCGAPGLAACSCARGLARGACGILARDLFAGDEQRASGRPRVKRRRASSRQRPAHRRDGLVVERDQPRGRSPATARGGVLEQRLATPSGAVSVAKLSHQSPSGRARSSRHPSRSAPGAAALDRARERVAHLGFARQALEAAARATRRARGRAARTTRDRPDPSGARGSRAGAGADPRRRESATRLAVGERG